MMKLMNFALILRKSSVLCALMELFGGSKAASKRDFSQCFQLQFYFGFLCLNMHKIVQRSNRKQNRMFSKRFYAIGKCFRDDPGQIPNIAMTDIHEITWLYYVISYISVIAMYAVWPELSGKRFPCAQFAFKPSLFAV